MIKETLNYYDRVDGNIDSIIIREKVIKAETEHELFIKFYKLNNSLRYCNGAYYKFKKEKTQLKYKYWLNSDEYKKISFQLYYGGGIVD